MFGSCVSDLWVGVPLLSVSSGAPGGFLSLGRLCGGIYINGAGVGLGSCRWGLSWK